MQIDFLWWNVQDFAHFDEDRESEAQWPTSETAYSEKLKRLKDVLDDINEHYGRPTIIALCETTRYSIARLRDTCFKGYKVHSMDVQDKSELQVGFIYSNTKYFERVDPIVVPRTTRGTRPMAALDYFDGDVRIRFVACHWTARFQPEKSLLTRESIASYLSEYVYEYLNDELPGKRHIVILGDLNEEPFGLVENRLFAIRSRKRAQDVLHYTDVDQKRQRLYNCSWRIVGEKYPHEGLLSHNRQSVAGTYYYREEKSWYTFDHIIVDGGLLQMDYPFLDEGSIQIASVPAIFDSDGLPAKFEWLGNQGFGAASDHLPIFGSIHLR
jgi:hypothetical protein